MRKLVVLILAICLIITTNGCGESNYDQEISEINERLDSLESINVHSSEPFSSTETDREPDSEVSTELQQSESFPAYDEFEKLSQQGGKYGRTQTYYSYGFRSTFNGDFVDLLVVISKDWKDIEVGKRLVLELKNEWINATCTIEPDASITSEEDCLQKVQEITAGFQSEGIKESADYYLSVTDAFSRFFEEDIIVPEGMTGGTVNLDDTWWIEKRENYANGTWYYEYYHEKSTHTNEKDMVYSLLEYGAFVCAPDTKLGGFRVTINVTFYDFDTYYESLPTDAEKKKANAEIDYPYMECECNGANCGIGLLSLLFPGAKVNNK